jgi:TolA-binding protein
MHTRHNPHYRRMHPRSSNSPDTDTDSDSESDEYTPPKIREQIEQLNKDIAKNNEQLQSILAQLKNK